MAVQLRKHFIFYVVPMLNPDGVIMGNHRTSFIGRDMNRAFSNPNPKLNPEASNLRELIKDQVRRDRHRVLAFFDLHSHSGRKSLFMYGPHYPLHSRRYLKIRVIPRLLSELTDMFRYYSCKFRVEKYKNSCARIALWRDFGIPNSFTIESSVFGYLNKDRETIPFDSFSLQRFATLFG